MMDIMTIDFFSMERELQVGQGPCLHRLWYRGVYNQSLAATIVRLQDVDIGRVSLCLGWGTCKHMIQK
jgi:hypothetical protein